VFNGLSFDDGIELRGRAISRTASQEALPYGSFGLKSSKYASAAKLRLIAPGDQAHRLRHNRNGSDEKR
jgi:hypothetical protein